MKVRILIAGLSLLCLSLNAQKADNLVALKNNSKNPIFSHLGEAPRGGGFSMATTSFLKTR